MPKRKPKNRRLTTGHQAGCDVVKFHACKRGQTRGHCTGPVTTVLRCPRKGGLARAAKLRYDRMRRAGEICRKGSGKNKKFSTNC